MSDPNKNMGKEINRLDDVFHSQCDDIDFDYFFVNFDSDDNDNGKESQINSIKDDAKIVIDLTVQEEQRLSQKLSQLSTFAQEQNDENDTKQSTTTKKRPPLTPPTIPLKSVKKMKFDLQGDENPTNEMPNYLSKNNTAFEQIMNPIVQKTANTIDMEDLRQMAHLKHKLALVDLNISLWTIYLRSGTGPFKDKPAQKQQAVTTATTNPYVLIWPEEVKLSMISNCSATLKANQIDHDTCLHYVEKMLHEFKEQNAQYKAQLKERQQRLSPIFTTEMEVAIDKFVEQYGIALHRILIESKTTVVEYDYNDRLIELEYHREVPHEYQLNVFKNLTQAKLDKEIAKMEVSILKQRIIHNHLPSSVDSLQIPVLASLNTINDNNTRQHLIDRWAKILQRTKSDMMTVHVAVAEEKMNEYQKKFDADYSLVKENQRSGPSHKKLTQAMLDILERRLKNMNERLIRLYNLKIRFFIKAPMVKKS